MVPPALRWLNLALLVLFPLSWFAPLMRAGMLPLFGLDEISVITGLQSLWEADPLLALLVTLLAVFIPLAKTALLALVHAGWLVPRILPVLAWAGRLAMADVFLIALYVVVAKGIGVGRIEIAWGLYAFTACILLSLAVSSLTERRLPH